MLSTMMQFALTVSSILQHASRFHRDRGVASRESDGSITRRSYQDLESRCRMLCGALGNLGIRPGDRVATLAGNSLRHLEIYYAVPMVGAIVHTVNPRLFFQQIQFIINHARDTVLFIDPEFVPLVSKIRSELRSVRDIIVLGPVSLSHAEFPAYEDILDQVKSIPDLPKIDENTAASLCYTSGTTGDPKGVLYSHRSIVLHSLMMSGADWFAIRKSDTVLPIVPMYHVNAWSL